MVSNDNATWIWKKGTIGSDGSFKLAFSAGGWIVLVISILSGLGIGASIVPNFINRKSS
jgi:hypothetical protein